ALSRPVVASNVGGIPEMIEDGVTGLLVPPHDPVALAGAITSLLRDHQLADLLGRAGHDLVHQRLCLEQLIASVEGIYEDAAAARRLADLAAGERSRSSSRRQQRSGSSARRRHVLAVEAHFGGTFRRWRPPRTVAYRPPHCRTAPPGPHR